MLNSVERYVLKRKLEALSWRVLWWGVALFFLVQLSSCYPTLGYPIRMVMRPINQTLYGKKVNVDQSVLAETYVPYNDPKPKEYVEWAGHRLRKTFVIQYKGTGRVVWLDSNNAMIKAWFLSAGNEESARMYKEVAPFDLSLVFGKTGAKENMKYLEFSHEENCLFSRKIDPRGYFDKKDITNIHIIPATKSIKQVVEHLQWDDIVTVEGYLTDWQGTGSLSFAKYDTARKSDDVSKYLMGGRRAGLCKQLYLTKIILNGYEYR